MSSACGGAAASASVGNTAHTQSFGSRVSLANTSLTSAPDLSTLSSLTLARRADTDQASLQSEKMSVDVGLSASRCSLVSPDSKSVKSPQITRNGALDSSARDGSQSARETSSSNRISGRDKKSIRTNGSGANSLYSSTATSHPHLATMHNKLSNVNGNEIAENLSNLGNRRSVQSDDGCYEQPGMIPYTNFSQFSNGVDYNSDKEDDEDMHEGRVAGARPNNLSVSQTTLIRDPDTAPGSEPATPRAGETPDTVRLYVPYAEDDEHHSTPTKGPVNYRHKQTTIATNEIVVDVVTKSGDTKAISLVGDLTINDSNINSSNSNTSYHAIDDPKIHCNESSLLNGTDLHTALTLSDPHKIKIRVDADETLSSMSSPRDGGSYPTSPHGLSSAPTSPGKFVFSDGMNKSLHEQLGTSTKPEVKHDNVSPKKIYFGDEYTVNNGTTSTNTSHSYQTSDRSHQPNSIVNSQVSDPSTSLSSDRSSESALLSSSVVQSSLGSTIRADPDRSSLTSNSMTHQRPSSSGTSRVTATPAGEKKSSASLSPVHVTISSYYETKHQRKSTSPPGQRDSYNYESVRSGVQHYYHHRQSSSSPPLKTTVMSSPSHNVMSSQSAVSPPSSLPRPPPHPYGTRQTRQRNSSEHSTYGIPESASHSQMQSHDIRPPLSSSTSSINTGHKVVTSYNTSQTFHSKIIERSLNSSSTSENKYVESRRAVPDASYSSSSREFENRFADDASRFAMAGLQDFKHFIADEPLRESFPRPQRFLQSHLPQERFSSTNTRTSNNTARKEETQKISSLGPPFQVPSSVFRNSQR